MKHSPIPEHLGYKGKRPPVGRTPRRREWQPLPPDLDKLFRASPALAEALREIEGRELPKRASREMALAEWACLAGETARSALKLLED